MVKIRAWQPSDVPQIVQLVAAILEKEFPQDQAAYPPQDLTRLEEAYRPPESTFLVAEEAGRIVGTCGVKAEDGKTAILRRLFVGPFHRGQGVGLDLLKEALAFCRRRGFQEAIIRTSTSMKGAIRLCKSLGFEEDGRWTLGGVTLIRFRLRLT